MFLQGRLSKLFVIWITFKWLMPGKHPLYRVVTLRSSLGYDRLKSNVTILWEDVQVEI